jgi:hypothetical protein
MCFNFLNFFVNLGVLLLDLCLFVSFCMISKLAVALLANIPLPGLQVCALCAHDPNSYSNWYSFQVLYFHHTGGTDAWEYSRHNRGAIELVCVAYLSSRRQVVLHLLPLWTEFMHLFNAKKNRVIVLILPVVMRQVNW